MIATEVLAVEPRGRISAKDLGLWNDEQAHGLKRLVQFVQSCGTKICAQLAHAGRKSHITQTAIGPSTIAYDDVLGAPAEASLADIQGGSTISAPPLFAPLRLVSTRSRFMPQTDTSCTNFWRRSPMRGPTIMADRSRTACAFLSKSSRPYDRSGLQRSHFSTAFVRRISEQPESRRMRPMRLLRNSRPAALI